MKRIVCILTIIAVICCLGATLSSCDYFKGNIDEAYAYDYAIITMPGGEVKTLELRMWNIVSTELIQVYDASGTYYYTSTKNCTLVDDPDVKIDVTKYALEDFDISLYKNACFMLPDGTVFSGEVEWAASASNPTTIHMLDGSKYMVSMQNCVLWK